MSPVFETFDDDLEDLAERAASPDAGIRRVAMLELAEAVGPEAKALLLKGLGDNDATVLAAAAKALDEHDGPEVVEAWFALSRMRTRTCVARPPKRCPRR